MIARTAFPISRATEPLYVGIDVSKHTHYVCFLSKTLLTKNRRVSACPTFKIDNSRHDFETLKQEMQRHAPLEKCSVLLEKTGHYHFALRQYLHEVGVSVYELHVQKRLSKIKNDKRDSQSLANLLYNQIELGVQVPDSEQVARRVSSPTETAQILHVLSQRRYELSQSTTRIKNKLTAVIDELFPEFVTIIPDPNGPTALNIREALPTAQAIARANFGELKACRAWSRPGDEALHKLQELAENSIGTRDVGRLTALTIEQHQLIDELRLLQRQISEADDTIAALVEESREGQILLSMGIFGVNQAAAFLSVVGSIENVESASKLKGLSGWHPVQSQTGISMDSMVLSKEGNRILRNTMFLVGMRAIQGDNEWHELYNRLVPKMCQFDERLGVYRGRRKPLGHVIGRILAVAYALLKKDHNAVTSTPPGQEPPPPTLYDREVHRAHRRSG